MENQEQINAYAERIKKLEEKLGKIAIEVIALKNQPHAEVLDFSGIDAALSGAEAKAQEVDDLNADA